MRTGIDVNSPQTQTSHRPLSGTNRPRVDGGRTHTWMLPSFYSTDIRDLLRRATQPFPVLDLQWNNFTIMYFSLIIFLQPKAELMNNRTLHRFPHVFFMCFARLSWLSGVVRTQHKTLTSSYNRCATDCSTFAATLKFYYFFNFPKLTIEISNLMLLIDENCSTWIIRNTPTVRPIQNSVIHAMIRFKLKRQVTFGWFPVCVESTNNNYKLNI